MKLKPAAALVLASTLFTGCASTTIGLRSSNTPSLGMSVPPPGSSYSQGSVALQADVSAGAFFGSGRAPRAIAV